MNHSHPSPLSANEVPRSSGIVSEGAFSLLSLMLLLLTLGVAHAQNNPMDSPPLGRSDTGQYKSGETPTGQSYGVIKEGEPHKNKDTKKKSAPDEKKDTSREGKPNIIERDPSETHEGSGPDPFGRY